MTKLESLLPSTSVRGILPDSAVTVVNVQWFGSEALELTYKDPAGRVGNQLLYRHDEPRLEVDQFLTGGGNPRTPAKPSASRARLGSRSIGVGASFRRCSKRTLV
jgi:hypothetical protein